MSEFKIESIPGKQEGVRILRLAGQFTLQNVFDFQSAMRAGTDPVNIIDLTEVPYMDSASLGAVMGAHVFFHRNQRRYALVGVVERVRTLFEVGGVEKLLIVYPTVEEAVLHFATPHVNGKSA
jgi:anti-sigma B factor antagonist